MSERLNLQDLTDLLADKQGLTKKDAELFLRELFGLITNAIDGKDSVKIKDFGTFKLVKVNSRKSVDVNTGQDIEISAHYKLSFTPDKSLKDLINTPFAHFESVVVEDGVSFENIAFEAANETDNQPSEEEEEIITETAITAITTTETTTMEKEQEENVEKESEITEPIAEKENDDDEYEPELGESKTTRNVIIVVAIVLLILCGYLFKDEIFGALGGGDSTSKNNKGQVEQAGTQSLPADSLTAENDTVGGLDMPSTDDDLQAAEGTAAATNKAKYYKPKDTIAIKRGDTLRKLALKHYGDKTFWVYIYQENIDKIKDFNNITIGTKLVIPAPEKYGINVKDSQSLAKATVLEDKYFAK